jgi:hypothetical protein
MPAWSELSFGIGPASEGLFDLRRSTVSARIAEIGASRSLRSVAAQVA